MRASDAAPKARVNFATPRRAIAGDMQAKKRYILLIMSCAFLAYCYFGGYRLKSDPLTEEEDRALEVFARADERAERGGREKARAPRPRSRPRACRMDTCFDYSRCGDEPKVYVYPTEGAVSASYRKILAVVRESRYSTEDPREACLLLPAVDTLDGDPLSPERAADAAARLARLPHWNGGRNHLLFNLYAGTWPDYSEEALGFEPGLAMLARASASEALFRPGFDVSLPLFHRQHPERGGAPPAALANTFPASRRHLLAFKGKRYVHGIGSETRNSLWHLHDARDLVLVTTCRHGKSWRDLQDDRCDDDNREYDRFDYEQLLSNSTFCLVARGRRLGSYRFLEALAAGCIPVLLSNGWRLPFDERIDWRRAALWADERLLLQVPELVRSVPAERVLALRQQTQLLWQQYFSSVEKIVFTTIEIILERVLAHRNAGRRDALAWNSAPGALAVLPDYGDARTHFPFHADALAMAGEVAGVGDTAASAAPPAAPLPAPPAAPLAGPPSPPATPGAAYTALLYATANTPALHKLLGNLARSEYCGRVVVVWDSDRAAPRLDRLQRPAPRDPLPLLLVEAADHYPGAGVAARWRPLWALETAGVFSLDGDATLLAEELDFAFHVWRHFPERIVGYPARHHYWDEAKGAWGYTSKWTNEYSLVLTGAALVHRYYLALYERALAPLLHKSVAQAQNCEDILLNCLVAHVTRRPPIKLTQRKRYKPHHPLHRSPWNDPDHFIQRQSCLNTFAAVWGYMPLVRSRARLDPLLFKDPVSNLRKKYRQMELVPS